MGSIRVKGTIVRSCSRKSDLIAAKILNTRCQKKGISPPNPAAGFLNDEELASCTQVRKNKKKSKRKKTTKKSKKSAGVEANTTTNLRNIFWGKQQQAWMGNVRVKGTIVRSCSRISQNTCDLHYADAEDVMAAKILNTRCREKGITPPNPEVGYCDCGVAGARYVNNQSFVEITSNIQCQSDSPKKSHEYETINVYDPYSNMKHQLMPEKTCPYKNVFWNEKLKEWVGSVQYNECFIRSSSKDDASHAARMLNSRCLTAGALIPNPEVGFLNHHELQSLRFETNVGTRFPPSINLKSECFSTKSELFTTNSLPSLTDSDFHRFTAFNPPPTPDGSGIPISPANFDLPPCSTSKDKLLTEFHALLSPRICHDRFDRDNYRTLNTTMFNYMSDLLPKEVDEMEDYLDDLPFSGNWSSGLLSTY